jgi:hypothetical protein
VIGSRILSEAPDRGHERGEHWAGWVREHAMRLLWPTTVYVTAMVIAAAVAITAGAGTIELEQAGHLVALQLWFLPVYLLLIFLTPVVLAAYRRWGLAVPAIMALGAAAVDLGVVGYHVKVVGYANYLLVWGSMYVWGFAWQDGTLTRPWWRPYALAGAGVAALALLVGSGPFPIYMVGAGEKVGNTTPPSIALLAFAAAQIGLVLAAAPAVSRLLQRPRWWRPVTRLNPAVMLVYLWHMVPVVIVAIAFYPTGVLPQPAIGSAEWWELRPAWIALLATVLIPLIAGLVRLHRPLLAVLPTGLTPARPWSAAVLVAGLAAAGYGLTSLAIGGFAPGGRLSPVMLVTYACGLLLILLSGPPSPRRGPVPARAGSAAPAGGPGHCTVHEDPRETRQPRRSRARIQHPSACRGPRVGPPHGCGLPTGRGGARGSRAAQANRRGQLAGRDSCPVPR